ncbi:hypothetical protein EDC01DRAFT_482309 [Geopyxis carbonaria]|nr:hypothetical protein EDC01DRAFT_482309 [Geopyxis carbonaria]
MDITFITIHDLSADGLIMFASGSVFDVLGYDAEELTGRSCFDYFHPQELPFARSVHGRGVHLDRASVLAYCSLRRKDGVFVRCECVFTVVHSVIFACTSLYRYTEKSQARAIAAPIVRRVFSSSQADPRYHMLSHLSSKFTTPMPPPGHHEPRAAMVLNRFARTLPVMYATHGLDDILGIQAEDMAGVSFYQCIARACLVDAVTAIERAKENDSIAYLRFKWRDPRLAQDQDGEEDDMEARLADIESVVDSIDGSSTDGGVSLNSRSTSSPSDRGGSGSTPDSSMEEQPVPDGIDVECVVSCTSDGLVVIIRKARDAITSLVPSVFATPWGVDAPQPAQYGLPAPQQPAAAPSGPLPYDFMDSIRQVAVFAWSLRSINEDVMSHANGAQPDGMDKVGGFETPKSVHGMRTNKRTREWEASVRQARDGAPYDVDGMPQWKGPGGHPSKRRY